MEEDESVRRGKFTQTVGPTNVLPSSATALDFLKLLLSLNIIENIVLERNRYACQQFAAANKAHEDWDKVTVAEIMAFLGLLIGMGIKRLSCMRDYWSQDWVFGVPSLARVMPLTRFREILRYLHLNDNTKMLPRDNPTFDKLFKVRPFIESIKGNFKLQFNPHEHQSVDEAMIRFKGRTTLKQYMPMKPIKRGFKMWCRADGVNGYLCDFNIYTGRNADGVEYGLGYNVVTKLCQEIYGKWHKIIFDNFFTGIELAQELFTKKTLCSGTIRSNRRVFPKQLCDKKKLKELSRGDVIEMKKGPLLTVTWMDNKPVHLISTISQSQGGTIQVKRRKKDGIQQDIPCPFVVQEYNSYMGGVDNNDQLKSYYEIVVNSKKWWPRIFYDLVDRCIINAYILECESPNHTRRAAQAFSW